MDALTFNNHFPPSPSILCIYLFIFAAALLINQRIIVSLSLMT